jgi:four helix bundle protein
MNTSILKEMDKYELQNRTKWLAINIIRLTKTFPGSQEAKIITYQIIKSSTSIASNYRASCRAKSDKDFIAKLQIVEEECDETVFWLEMIEELKLAKSEDVLPLHKEANELLAIFVASITTVKKRINK